MNFKSCCMLAVAAGFLVFSGNFAFAQESSQTRNHGSVTMIADSLKDVKKDLSRVKVRKLLINKTNPVAAIQQLNSVFRDTGYQFVSKLSVVENNKRSVQLDLKDVTAYDVIRLICMTGQLKVSCSGRNIIFEASSEPVLDLSPYSDISAHKRLYNNEINMVKFTGNLSDFCKYLSETLVRVEGETPDLNFICLIDRPIRFNLYQRNVNFTEVLDSVCRAKNLSYYIEPFGVVIVDGSVGKQKNNEQIVVRNMSLRSRLETQQMPAMKFREMPLTEVVEKVIAQQKKNAPEQEPLKIKIDIPEEDLQFYAVSGATDSCALIDVLKYACDASGTSMRIEGDTLIIYSDL